MAKLDTDRIWRSLGTFWSLFPEEERVYLATYWEAYADIVADLWGLTFQIDRSRSLFSTRPTFERRNVLVNISGLRQQRSFGFELAGVTHTPQGATIVRGFLPRDRRTFKVAELPPQGLIRIGVDTLKYIAVNAVPVVGGIQDGYVREATFTLADSTTPHDYDDSIDLNESFFRTELLLSFRVDQVPGQNYVDATSSGAVVDLNSTGILRFGTPGLNYEQIQYQSLSVVGDRYVFALPPSWSPGQVGPSLLQFPHYLGDEVACSVLTPSRWRVETTGVARVFGDNAAVFVIDDEPGSPGASGARLTSSVQIEENSDFDLAVTMFVDSWPVVASSEKRAGVEIVIGSQTYVLYLRRSAASVAFVSGLQTSPATTVLGDVPDHVELRITRSGATVEFSALVDDGGDFVSLGTATATGQRATLTLLAADDGTDTASRIRFDEIVRRQGQAAGSTRLESTFIVDDLFPYRYTCDVGLVSATSLRDVPRIMSESLITVDVVDDVDAQYIRAIGTGDEFSSAGVPVSGWLLIGDVVVVYDEVVRDGVVFEFKIRGKIDPDLLPMAAGTNLTARTRELTSRDHFRFPTPGELWLRDLPTRDKMWAPVAEEDQRHVQRLYGPLVGFDAPVSSNAYLSRVQGAWFALMQGPAIENIRIGVHLTMGLPVAKVSGVVEHTFEHRNLLGEVDQRGMVILGVDGAVTHYLDPSVQGITWAFEPGQRVDRFTPLTSGVEIYDSVVRDDWPSVFGQDPESAERFNTFGVLVDLNVLNSDTSLEDAIRFALKIKPTWTSLLFHLLLTSGNETLIVEDDMFFAQIAWYCEDVSFDEGNGPPPDQDLLRLGDGHKLGQGKRFGSASVFKPFPALGIGLHLGTSLTMGMAPRAYYCAANDHNLAIETVQAIPVVEVDVGS